GYVQLDRNNPVDPASSGSLNGATRRGVRGGRVLGVQDRGGDPVVGPQAAEPAWVRGLSDATGGGADTRVAQPVPPAAEDYSSVILDLADGSGATEDSGAGSAERTCGPALGGRSGQSDRASTTSGIGECPHSFQPFHRTDFREGGHVAPC